MKLKSTLKITSLAILVMMFLQDGLASAQTTTTPKTKTVTTPSHVARVRQRNIKIRVSNNGFSPNKITIYTDERVVLELYATDSPHSISVPDLSARTDIPTGQPSFLTLTPEHAGEYAFSCDSSCGENAYKLQGVITVVDRPSQ